MKLSMNTVAVLKSFSQINSSIWISPGKKLKTISTTKGIFAEIEIEDEFPAEFGIYDLPQFLSAINLMKDADIEFGESAMTITDGHASMIYTYTPKTLISTPPEKELALPSIDVEFELPLDTYKSVQSACSVLKADKMVVFSDKGKIYVGTASSTDKNANNFKVEVGEADSDFRHVFSLENLRFLPLHLNVKISDKGIACFSNDTNAVKYWVAADK